MNCSTYLRSLGIAFQEQPTKIGRLAVIGHFEINDLSGIVLRPRRGGISDRYLGILAKEQVSFVLVDGTEPLIVYDLTGPAPRRLRALPIQSPSGYPNVEVLEAVVRLLTEAVRSESEALELGCRLIGQKLDDERKGTNVFRANLALEEQTDFLRGFFGEELGPSPGPDRVQTAAAFLAGYRLTPTSPNELAILLEFVSRLTQGVSSGGLPPSLAFAFSGEWARAKRLAVAAHSVGSHLLALTKADEGTAVLPTMSEETLQFLRGLFPSSSFVQTEFLNWSPEEQPDRLIVVPPPGSRITAQQHLERSRFGQRDGKRLAGVGAETLFIEHALRTACEGAVIMAVVPEGLLASVGNSEFREWLLRQAQLLAVISLPPGSCFRGTSVRCSLLYIRKAQSPPADYSILFAELQEHDLLDPSQIDGLRTAIDNAVEGRIQRCA
jgi:hypothetical protein